MGYYCEVAVYSFQLDKELHIIWAGSVKITTEGGICVLLLYVTFDCADSACVLRTLSECCHFNFSNTQFVIPTSGLKTIPWILFSGSSLCSFLVPEIAAGVFSGIFCKYDETQKYNFRIWDTAQDVTLST
jgi:hypothetical protein